MSRKRFCALLDAGPSVPMDTEMPRASIFAIGATPEASFMLEAGLWTIAQPHDATTSRSASSASTMWKSVVSSRRMPSERQYSGGRSPCAARHAWVSPTVSERWRPKRKPSSSASARQRRSRPGFVV